MTTNSKILCDADFVISLFIDIDSNHAKATNIFERYNFEDFIILNITLYEVATVLSRILPQNEAIEALKLVRSRFDNPINFNPKWDNEVYNLYNTFEKKNISFFDCACMIYAKKVKAKIACFDKFYDEGMLVV